jgi:hypothetical protein
MVADFFPVGERALSSREALVAPRSDISIDPPRGAL